MPGEPAGFAQIVLVTASDDEDLHVGKTLHQCR